MDMNMIKLTGLASLMAYSAEIMQLDVIINEVHFDMNENHRETYGEMTYFTAPMDLGKQSDVFRRMHQFTNANIKRNNKTEMTVEPVITVDTNSIRIRAMVKN